MLKEYTALQDFQSPLVGNVTKGDLVLLEENTGKQIVKIGFIESGRPPAKKETKQK